MNLVIPDIDKYILDLVDLRSLANLILVNKYFYELISTKPIMGQWKCIINMKSESINSIFIQACAVGFLEYAIYLVNEIDIDIHVYNDYAFRWSCRNGHLKLTQWLVCLGESSGYTKIDIQCSQ